LTLLPARPLRVFSRQKLGNGGDKRAHVLLNGRRKGVEPMVDLDEEFQRATRLDVFNANGCDRDIPAGGPLDLAFDVGRRIRRGGQDEDQPGGAVERVNDGFVPQHPAPVVPVREVALQPRGLQSIADRLGGELVLRGIADEHPFCGTLRHGNTVRRRSPLTES
jgi:hypothetical protein